MCIVKKSYISTTLSTFKTVKVIVLRLLLGNLHAPLVEPLLAGAAFYPPCAFCLSLDDAHLFGANTL